MRKHKSDEEKIANIIAKIVSDLRLDLDLVGYYLATIMPRVSQRRFQTIAEAMEEEKENQENGRKYHDYI
jgi:hypothetical protein